MNKKKIYILCLHMGYGGVERAIANFTNALCDDYEIEIICTYKLYPKPAFAVNSRAKIRYLLEYGPNKDDFLDSIKKFNFLKIIKEGYKSLKILFLRSYTMKKTIKEISENSIVISTRPLFHKLLSKYGKNVLKIAWEHAHPNFSKNYVDKLAGSCKKIDYLVTVSQNLAEFYREQYSNNLKSLIIKHIPLGLDKLPDKLSNLNNNNITFIGRLSPEKGVLELLDVFRLIKQEKPDCILNIVGDGPEKQKLIEKINKLNLKSSVNVLGYLQNSDLEKILLNTVLCINTSHYESFGLVILEAFSYGIPCLAFDSATGVSEIIDDNINGFIIKNRNINKMAKNAIKLLDNQDLIKKFSAEARSKSENYSINRLKTCWQKLFEL